VRREVKRLVGQKIGEKGSDSLLEGRLVAARPDANVHLTVSKVKLGKKERALLIKKKPKPDDR